MMCYHVSGYGGFGNGGAGLPGGKGGPGSKPGYPVGTGECFYEWTYNLYNREGLYKKTQIPKISFFLLQEWGQGGSHLLRLKLLNMVAYHIHYKDSASIFLLSFHVKNMI